MAQYGAVADASKNIWRFDPTTISGCTLWLDGSDSNTLFSNTAGTTPASLNGNVGFWKDKSISANNAITNSNVSYPTGFGTYASDNSVQFGGSAAYVLTASALPTGTSNATYFVVSKSNSGTNTGVFCYGGTTTNLARAFYYSTTTTANVTTNPNGTSSISSAVSGQNIVTYTYNNFIQSGWANGTSFSTNNRDLEPPISSVFFNTGTTVALLGALFNTTGLNGNIYEILVYNTALSNTERQTIEGYLAWKWGLQTSLPTTHPYYYAPRPFSRTFIPTDIEGCNVWLDAADRNTVTLTGSNVTTLVDKSGQGNDFTNASSTLTYTSTVNGLPVVDPGTTIANSTLTGPSITKDVSNQTYFIVLRCIPNAGFSTYFPFLNGSDFALVFSGARLGFYNLIPDTYNLSTLGGGILVGTGVQSLPLGTINGAYADMNALYGGNTFICCCVRQNGVWTMTLNGVPLTVSNQWAGQNQSPAIHSINPFYASNTAAQFGELVIYNTALTQSQRQAVEGYLAWKWGFRTGGVTTPTLYVFPTTHPFYKYPPPSLTPIQPELQLYKKQFDPSDLNPTLWLDVRDPSTYTTTNNRITSITSKGTQPVSLVAPNISFAVQIPSSTTIPVGGTGTTFTLNRAPFGIGVFSGITVTVGGVAISNCTLTGGSLTLTTGSSVTISNGAAVTAATYTLGLQANTTIPTGGTGTSFTMNNTATGSGTGTVSNIPLIIGGAYVPNCSITNGSATLTTPSITVANGADIVVQAGPLVSTSSRSTGFRLPYMDFSSGGTNRITGLSIAAYNSTAIAFSAISVALDGVSIVISTTPAVTLTVNQPIVFNGSGTVIPGTTNITAGTIYYIRAISTLVTTNVNFPTNYITISTTSGGAAITGLTAGTLSGVTGTAGSYLATITTSVPHNIPNGSPVSVTLDVAQFGGISAFVTTSFGNVQSVPSSTQFTFHLTSSSTSLTAGSAGGVIGYVQYGNNPIVAGNLSSDLTTLTLTTAMPHNLQTGCVVQPFFHGPSLPSQWNAYTSANVRSSNPSNTTFVGSISGTTLTVTSGTPPGIGAVLSGTGVTTGTTVSGVITSGSSYIVSVSQTVSAGTTFTSAYSVITFVGSISGTTLTYISGTVPSIGMLLTGGGITAGAYIISGTSPTFTLNVSQTLSSTTLTGSNYSIELTFPSTKWPILPNTLNNGTSLNIISTSGTTFTFSGNISTLLAFGSMIVFTSSVGSVPAGAYYIASTSGSTATLSSSRTLTPLLNPGTTSGLTVPTWGYNSVSALRLCSAGTSTITSFNNLNTYITGIDYTNRVISLGSTNAAPVSGAVNMSLIANPGVQINSATLFAHFYSFGMSHANVLNSTQFTIPISNNINAPYSLATIVSQSYGGVDYTGDMANYGYTDFRFGGNSVGGYSFAQGTYTQAILTYPASGYILEGTSNITNLFNTTTSTILYVNHSTTAPLRTGGPGGFGGCSIATAVTSGNIGGRDTTSGGRDFSIRPFGSAQSTQHTLVSNNLQASLRPPNLIDTISGFRVYSAVFNSTATSVGDVPTNTRNQALNGWRYDYVNGTFAFNSTFFGTINIALTANTALQPTVFRLGGDTTITNFGYDGYSYFDGGISEILVFNTPLTLEQRQLLEGYLAQKYSAQYLLANQATTNSTTTFIHPYRLNPNSIVSSLTLSNIYTQGLTAWFDATNSSTIGFVSGANINSWTSAGGFTSLILTPNSTNYPVLALNAQNGLPGVRFSITAGTGTPLGTSSYNNPISSFSTINVNNEFTIISVYKQSTYTSGQTIANISTNASSGNPRLLINTNQFSYQNNVTEQTKTYTANTNNQAYITIQYRRGNILYTRVNGTTDVGATTSGTNLAIPTSIGSTFGLTIGGYIVSSPTTSPFAGDVYEHIIYRYALTDQAIYQVEGYLAWKWGLQTTLPTTHPYYKVRA